jgi:HD-GYP domain-containing protein (c-di-GMP phosphodiesterase class II)
MLPRSQPDEALLKKVSLGAMLMDIGMLKLPMLLTQKNDTLTAQEYAKVKTHVGIALKLVKPLDKVDEISIQVIQQHHERLDGSGYPDGLQESQISLYGRMAAIVDTYDSLTSSRPFRKALKPADALVKLTEATQTLDQELVQKFITCMGAYPAGSLVKLASGKIAMVIRINKTQPLSPVVMVFYDTQTRQDKVMRIDLSKTDDKIISSIELDEVNMGIPQLLQQNLS